MIREEILMADYTYMLPSERIANHPLEQRDASKLLVYKSGGIDDAFFGKLPKCLSSQDLLILNNTKVIEARLVFKKDSGGVIEVFCLEPFEQSMESALQQTGSTEWKCLVGGASKWKPGQVLQKKLLVDGEETTVEAIYQPKLEDSFVIRFNWRPAHLPFVEVLHTAGAIPLPPYIKRAAEKMDVERYQTIFGEQAGSVAAPTAALHFTKRVFQELEEKEVNKTYITLNVGAGTFKPVKSESIGGHHMHGEDFTITKETLQNILIAKRVIAVGTTSLRTIESLHWMGVKLLQSLKDNWHLQQWEAYDLDQSVSYQESVRAIITWMEQHNKTELQCRTSLLIAPGYSFKIPTGLVTNFHQPGSTLLLLVAAFIGNDWKRVYQHALENNYRFLSYGDSSLLWRGSNL